MAGFTPKISNEPSVLRMYRGCFIYTYFDKQNQRKYVMTHSNGTIKVGTREAERFKDIEELGEVFKVEKVMEV